MNKKYAAIGIIIVLMIAIIIYITVHSTKSQFTLVIDKKPVMHPNQAALTNCGTSSIAPNYCLFDKETDAQKACLGRVDCGGYWIRDGAWLNRIGKNVYDLVNRNTDPNSAYSGLNSYYKKNL